MNEKGKQVSKVGKITGHSQSGITLIALIVTIIVLIILAGVAIAMLSGQNGVLTRAQESKNLTTIAGVDEQVKLSYMSARTSLSSNAVSKEGYIATKAEEIKDLADEVAKDLGVTAITAPGTGKLNTEGYTVEYYLDKPGDESSDGNGYIVIWYTDNSLRSTMNREEAITKNKIVDATENKSVNEAVLVQVIHVENYRCELSTKGLTSVTDGNQDIKKESFGETSLSEKLGFTGTTESEEEQPNPNEGFWINNYQISKHSLQEVLHAMKFYLEALATNNKDTSILSEYGIASITFDSQYNNYATVKIKFTAYSSFEFQTSVYIETDADTGDSRIRTENTTHNIDAIYRSPEIQNENDNTSLDTRNCGSIREFRCRRI